METQIMHKTKTNRYVKLHKDLETTSPRSLPSVPSKSKTSVEGSISTHLANQMPFVV